MEASQKPPELFEATGTVRPIGDRVVIENLAIDDPRVAEVVRQRAEVDQSPVQTVTNAIEIGARVLEREGMAAEVDYVQREFERTATQVREQFTEQARGLTEAVQAELQKTFSEDGGLLGKTLESHSDELTQQITKHFSDDSSGAVQHRVRELVEKSLREQRESLVKHLSSDGESNPLADFKRGVQVQLTETVRSLKREEEATREKLAALQGEVVKLTEQTQAGKALAEAEDAGTRKGRTFEERVYEALDTIADARGDAAFHVGDAPGKGGSKKGDAVVEIDSAAGPTTGRVVFEVKNKKLGKRDAWEELNAAMAEREATFAVLVVAGEDRVPSGREQLQEYEGNKLIVAVDPEDPVGLGLELAYRYARCRVILEREGEMEMNAPAVRDAAAEALSALKQGQSIKLNLTKAQSGIASAKSGLEEMGEAVKTRLERIESLAISAGD